MVWQLDNTQLKHESPAEQLGKKRSINRQFKSTKSAVTIGP